MQKQQAHINPRIADGFYFHPRPDRRTPNTYVELFYRELKERVNVVNKGNKEESRSGELLRHVLHTKVLVLNWPEDIIFLRKGLLQAFLFNLCTLLIKIRGGKVMWICHNRKSHHKGKVLLSKWNRAFFRWIADTIVVHSADALEAFKDVAGKTIFMPHPRYNRQATQATLNVQESEVLIWGSITPYKGLDAFIAGYKQRGANFKVSIRGKASADYFAQLTTAAAGTKIALINELLSEAELQQAFARCSIILLPYVETDTFSSGALIHSLNARKIVIGPHVGNFIDLAAAKACLTYRNEEELFTLTSQLLTHPDLYQQTLAKLQAGIDRYYEANSWQAFTSDFLRKAGYRLPEQPDATSIMTETKLSASQTL